MGWDVILVDPVTKEELFTEEKHQIQGGTYAVGGTNKLWVSITYNYSKFYYATFPEGKGLNWLSGKLAAETIPVIREAINKLGNDVTNRYWDATEGNAKQSLYKLLALAQLRPDGMWELE